VEEGRSKPVRFFLSADQAPADAKRFATANQKRCGKFL